jgi:Zn finger protein HypA/HybF involved in hydrogenase expression
MLAATSDELVYIIAVLSIIGMGWLIEQIKDKCTKQTTSAESKPSLREQVAAWIRRKARERCPSCGRKLEVLSPGWMRCPTCHWHALDQAKAVAIGLESLKLEVDHIVR